MTAHQQFVVIEKYKDFEIHEFLPCLVADVTVTGDISSSATQGFRSLFNYISQNKISMTAPVLEEELSADRWRISFVMPEGSSLSGLPTPLGSPVTLRELPKHRAAVLAFTGRATEKAILHAESRLRELMQLHGLKATGKVRIARFDPPWKPPFIRHNEVILPLE